MKVLIFGSRSLTWRHLPVFRALAFHSTLDIHPYEAGRVPDMDFHLMHALLAGGDDEWPRLHRHAFTLLNGDGPPGRERGAIGADKLAVLACMEAWPEDRRRMRWFPPEPRGDEIWAQAARRRNREMVEAKPDRAYCVHTDLDSSKGSSMTASLLTSAGISFWYVRVTQAGALVSVEKRSPTQLPAATDDNQS